MSEPGALPTLTGSPSADLLARNAYEVLASWNPGHSAEFRQMVVLVGVLLTILVLAAAILLPRRARILAIAFLSLTFAFGIVLWSRTHPLIARLTGAIQAIDDSGAAQTDRWNVFASAVDGSAGTLDWIDGTAPILPEDSRGEEISLDRDAAGRPVRFRFKLRAGRPIAFITRAREVRSNAMLGAVKNSIFEDLAKRCYLREGSRIAGENDSVIVISR